MKLLITNDNKGRNFNNIITTSTGQAVFGDDGWSEDIMLDGLNQ